jgi:hypothetical protein
VGQELFCFCVLELLQEADKVPAGISSYQLWFFDRKQFGSSLQSRHTIENYGCILHNNVLYVPRFMPAWISLPACWLGFDRVGFSPTG